MSASLPQRGGYGPARIEGSSSVVIPTEPGWKLSALGDGRAALRAEAWEGPLWPQVIVQLQSLPSPTSLAGYCETDPDVLNLRLGGTVLEMTPCDGTPPSVRVLFAHTTQTTGAIALQRHQLLSERMVLLASAQCAACDWPTLQPTLERIVAACHFSGDIPDSVPSAAVAPPSQAMAPAPPSGQVPAGGLDAGEFHAPARLLDRIAQDVRASRDRGPDVQLRADLVATGLAADGLPDARVVASALIRSDPAARFTLVSTAGGTGHTLDGFVSELGVATLVRSELPSRAAAATFTPVVGGLPSVLARALDLGARRIEQPAPVVDELLTWDELLAPFWSRGEGGWLSPADANGVVLHHLLWSRADGGPEDELVLVALDAGDRGWLTAVPDPVTARYSVCPSSPPELWRALCGLLGDLARAA